MSKDARWSAEQLEADFDALLDLDATARATALADIELRDPGRAGALRRWLGAVSPSAGLLETGTAPTMAVDRVGPWRLDGLIGRGGSGEVHLGRRADGAFEREVAVKLLRADRNADALIVEERRLLARLDHPNIARLLDGGVAIDGRPYLVTELIAGRPLDEWVRTEQPPLARRLRIFEDLAAAVAYAHANGVVHADLKPANVLIDAAGNPKLLDFGIAQRLGEQANGVRSLTPAYAAPEQFDGAEPGAHTDVHALGTLLYLVLCDCLPLEGAGLSLNELKTLRQQQDPQPPSRQPHSVRVSARKLRGDLDAIAMRCLARDPVQRYATVAALLEDLRAWREHRPVAARHGGRTYRARRYLRRHWLAGLALSALVLLTTLAVWQAHAARQAQFQAQAFGGVLAQIVAAGDMRTVRDPARETRAWLRGAVERLRVQPVSPAVDAEVLALLASALLSHDEYAAADSALTLADARAAADVDVDADEDAPAKVERERVRAELALVPLDFAAARRAVDAARAGLRGAPEPEALTLVDARVRVREGGFERARGIFERLIAARTAASGPTHVRTLAARLWLLEAQRIDRRNAEVLRDGATLLADIQHALPPDHPLLPPVLTQLAFAAIELPVTDDPTPRLAVAEAQLQQALALALKLYGEPSLAVINARDGLSLLLRNRGGLSGHIAQLRQMLAAEQALFGEHSVRAALTRFHLGLMVALQGDLAAGETDIRAADAIVAAGNALSELATIRQQHALLVLRSGDHARGLALAERAEATLRQLETPAPALLAGIERARARAWLATGEPAAAQRAAQAAVGLSRSADAASDALLISLRQRALVELALADATAVDATLAEISALEPAADAETTAIRNQLAALSKPHK